MHGTIDLVDTAHLDAARERANTLALSDYDPGHPELFKTDTF